MNHLARFAILAFACLSFTLPAVAGSPTTLTREAWRTAAHTPATPEEVDRLIARDLGAEGGMPAPLTTDEQLLRRVWLDLTGRLPLPADVREFVADKDPHKRAKVIDRLLDSDEYAEHWAHFWREVIVSRSTDQRTRPLSRQFDLWMAEQLKENRSWAEVVKAMITADGMVPYPTPPNEKLAPNGSAYFLLAHNGTDAVNERAAETSRIFLGIQIQCAQCHNHPFDQWKQTQFHELAAFYARLADQPVRENQRPVGWRLVSRPFGEHQMPSKDDPKKGTVMQPTFLDGKSAGRNLTDRERRRKLAEDVVSKDDYWFAAAYVNRIWGELLGQSFCSPVDDLGPDKQVQLLPVLVRVGASFQATDFDVKRFFRLVLNTKTYQRQIRPGNKALFTAATPTRLNADALWESLTGVLGTFGGPQPPMGPRGARRQLTGFEGLFKLEFAFDPSLKPDEVEGSIPQALMLMNSPQVNARLRVQGTNLLAHILKDHPEDDEAVRMVYLRTLARKPTDQELEKCRNYIAKAGKRSEAFEDILWALLNSTEFQTKR